MTENSQLDTATYEEAKRHLKAAFEHSMAAGRDVGEFTESAFERFGDSFGPYLRQFFSDVGEGRIKIQDPTGSAGGVVVGQQITAEERDAMIREAAYLRAEQRGFVNGSPEEDWLLAEQEIDERLARKSGLVGKGRQALSSAATRAEEELASLKDIVTRWLEEKSPVGSKSRMQQRSRERVVTRKPAPVKKKTAPAKKTTKKKTSVSKKPPTVKKKATLAKKTAKKTGVAGNAAVTKRSLPVKKKSAPAKKIVGKEKSTDKAKATSPSEKSAKSK